MPDRIVPPLPLLGADDFAPSERQPWQPPVVQDLIDRGDIPNDVFLGVAYGTVTKEDHWRCLAVAVPWNWYGELMIWFCSMSLVSIVMIGYRGIGSILSGYWFPALNISTTLGLLTRYVFWRSDLTRAVTIRQKQVSFTGVMLLANDGGIYHVNGDSVTLVPWEMINAIRETHGDVLVQISKSKKLDAWLYMPRRAFTDESNARLFADALRTLARSKGDPTVLSAEVRATFPPPQPL